MAGKHPLGAVQLGNNGFVNSTLKALILCFVCFDVMVKWCFFFPRMPNDLFTEVLTRISSFCTQLFALTSYLPGYIYEFTTVSFSLAACTRYWVPASASPVSFILCRKDFTGRKVLENSSVMHFRESGRGCSTSSRRQWEISDILVVILFPCI